MSNILATLEALFRPEDVYEVRVLHKRDGSRATHSGYYNLDSAKQAESFAKKYNKEGDQVYVTLNPVQWPVEGTVLGEGRTHVSRTTTDAMIKERRWLPMDFDPQRESGTSATMAQVNAAERLAQEVAAHLSQQGWPEPIVAESGNGVHLLYAVDLPANDGGLIKSVLKSLSDSFSTDEIKLDTTLHNAARIIKLYGTMSRKGESHRITRITNLPDRVIVSAEQLRAIAGVEGGDEPVQPKEETPFDFDLDSFLERAGLTVQSRAKMPDGRTRFILDRCYFNPEHVGSEVAIFMSPNGKLGYKCFHNSCAEHDWVVLREAVDGTPVQRVLQHFNVPERVKHESDLSLLPDVTADKRTEIGNAERIAALAAGRLLYILETKKWLKFDDLTGWEETYNDPLLLATKAAKHILVQAQDLPDAKDAIQAAIWYKTSLSARGLKAAVELAALRLSVSIVEFDADPYLLGVQNGVVDLRNGSFRPYQVTDRLLRKASVSFDANAECPTWERVIDEIFMGDKELVNFIKRSFGYSLTGLTTAQKLMFCYGYGANGKSTVLNVIREIAGSYSSVVQTDAFMDSGKGGGASPEIAALAGARVVIAQETDEGAHLKASLVKQLTGGDAITARHLYGTPFTFTPQFQVWLSGNHKPIVSGSDFGVWRRMTLIPFERRFEANEQDKHLDQKLKAEYAGILNWMIGGAVEFFKRGLGIPGTIEKAVDDYKSDMDHIGRWLKEACEGGEFAECKASDAHYAFKAWALEQGHTNAAKIARNLFGNRMKERGFEVHKRKDANYYVGFKPISDFSV